MKEKKKESKEITNHNFIDAWKNAFNGIIYATTTTHSIQEADCNPRNSTRRKHLLISNSCPNPTPKAPTPANPHLKTA